MSNICILVGKRPFHGIEFKEYRNFCSKLEDVIEFGLILAVDECQEITAVLLNFKSH
uniref:Uncharacterized protein n=1 Tax=Rhizophora mucronata TaxID=61149 RepID=A0A2P2QD57_RHIMU